MNLENTQLSSAQRVRRSLAIAVLTAALLLLRWIDPVNAGTFLPFHASCGAVTGLPCIFCGMTRALHLLLNGDFNRALYFNWLAFPVVAVVAFSILLFTIEIVQQRRIVNLRIVAHVNSRRLTVFAFGAVALWLLQAYLAVSQHKHELLNPRGPLYALFVR